MGRHEETIRSYQKRQVELRQQVRRLKAGRLGSGGEAQTTAVIQRTERQIADLERAIRKTWRKRTGVKRPVRGKVEPLRWQ
jgi:hypothetical protein